MGASGSKGPRRLNGNEPWRVVAPVELVEETAGYAEYVRWCGRTGAVRPPPTRFPKISHFNNSRAPRR